MLRISGHRVGSADSTLGMASELRTSGCAVHTGKEMIRAGQGSFASTSSASFVVVFQFRIVMLL